MLLFNQGAALPAGCFNSSAPSHLQAQQQPALLQQLQQISSLSRLSSSLHVTASAALGGDAQVRAETHAQFSGAATVIMLWCTCVRS